PSDVDDRVLGRQKLSQHRRAHRDRQDDRCYPGGEEEGHRNQETAVLERTREVGGEHDRDAAGCKQGDCTCDDCGEHRTAEEDATIHHSSQLSEKKKERGLPSMNILTDSAAILPVWSISRTAPLLSSLDSSRRHLSTSSPGTFPSER